jgi:uncharacterized protein YjbI with pentapeptide repeats
MSQKTNITRFKYSDDSDLLLSQWSSFDQKKYLRANLGLEYDTFIDLIIGASNSNSVFSYAATLFNNCLPGKIDDTLIESFRNIKLNNSKIVDTLVGFPFSLLKPNANVDSISDLAIDELNSSVINSCFFQGVNASYSILAGVKLKGCIIEDTTFKSSNQILTVYEGAKIDESSFRGTMFTTLDQGGNVIGADKLFIGCTIRDSDLSQIKAYNLNLLQTELFNCNIRNSTLHSRTWAEDRNKYSAIVKCILDGSSLSLSNSSDNNSNAQKLKIKDSSARNCEFKNEDANNKGRIVAERTIFDGSKFEHGEIRGDGATSCSFKNVDFNGSFNIRDDFFGEKANIRGSDFTGSNLTDYFATKADLIATGCTYDERTLWVDGTPL